MNLIFNSFIIFFVLTFSGCNSTQPEVTGSTKNPFKDEFFQNNFFKKQRENEVRKFNFYVELKEKIENKSFAIRKKDIVYTNKAYYQDIKGKKMHWNNAVKHCKNLDIHNSQNWYLPKKDEFLRLILVKELLPNHGTNYEINRLFNNIVKTNHVKKDTFYWTSTSYKSDKLNTSAITVDTTSHNNYYEVWNKSIKYRVICATKDKIVEDKDKIFTYGKETSVNNILKEVEKKKAEKIVMPNTLTLEIKKCKEKNKGWRFNSKNKVVCTNI